MRRDEREALREIIALYRAQCGCDEPKFRCLPCRLAVRRRIKPFEVEIKGESVNIADIKPARAKGGDAR